MYIHGTHWSNGGTFRRSSSLTVDNSNYIISTATGFDSTALHKKPIRHHHFCPVARAVKVIINGKRSEKSNLQEAWLQLPNIRIRNQQKTTTVQWHGHLVLACVNSIQIQTYINDNIVTNKYIDSIYIYNTLDDTMTRILRPKLLKVGTCGFGPGLLPMWR